MSRFFYIHRRGKIWYIRLKNPQTGKLLPAKSSGTDDREKAEYIAQKWIYEGIPQGKTRDIRTAGKVFTVDKILTDLKNVDSLTENDVTRFLEYFKNQGFINSLGLLGNTEIKLVDYLLDFWNFDTSLYVREKLSHGQKITRGYCADMVRWTDRYWKPYFLDLPLTELTRENLKEFSLYLSEYEKLDRHGKPTGKKLSNASINHILKAGKVGLKQSALNGLIKSDPAAGLMRFSGNHQKRGILTEKEAEKIFSDSADWGGNTGARLANYLSMQTGLRSGEVLALRVRDIDSDRIQVRHSWSKTEGLKAPKNGETRQVPLLPETRKMLIDYAKTNPAGFHPDSFIFFQIENPAKPMRQETLNARLGTALDSIGIDKDSRNLCFHSWRHFWVARMSRILDEKTAKYSGHATREMLLHYAAHADEKDFKKAKEATEQVFGKIIPFTPDIDKKAE